MNVATLLRRKGRSVVTAKPDMTLHEVASILAAHRIGAVVVMGPGGAIGGIVSERDIVQAVAREGETVLNGPVENVMTRDVITCRENSSIHEVMGIMTERRVRHLPVLEDGALVGIVSINDVIVRHVQDVEREASAMRSYISAD